MSRPHSNSHDPLLHRPSSRSHPHPMHPADMSSMQNVHQMPHLQHLAQHHPYATYTNSPHQNVMSQQDPVMSQAIMSRKRRLSHSDDHLVGMQSLVGVGHMGDPSAITPQSSMNTPTGYGHDSTLSSSTHHPNMGASPYHHHQHHPGGHLMPEDTREYDTINPDVAPSPHQPQTQAQPQPAPRTKPPPAQRQQSPQPKAKKSRVNVPWTPAEEQRLRSMRDAGHSWGDIAKAFPERTEGSVKKHWYKDMHYAEFAEDEVGSTFPRRPVPRAVAPPNPDQPQTDEEQSVALLNAIKEYDANRWKVIGQKLGKPAKACEAYAKEHFGNKLT